MSTSIAEQHNGQRRSLITKLAHTYGVEPSKMLNTLTSTAFRQRGDQQVTNEQMMALLIVADQYKLNPFTKEIYAFPDKSAGIVPIVGVDGWSRIINQHDAFDGMTFTAADDKTRIDDHHRPCPEYITCTIYRKDRAHPIEVTEYLDEVYRPPFAGRNGPVIGPWQSHTKRFLRHKAMIQCARLAFGFVGIYDQDEGERIIQGEAERGQPRDITPAPAAGQTKTESVKTRLRASAPKAQPSAPETRYDELASQIKEAEDADAVHDALAEAGALSDDDAKALQRLAAERRQQLAQEA